MAVDDGDREGFLDCGDGFADHEEFRIPAEHVGDEQQQQILTRPDALGSMAARNSSRRSRTSVGSVLEICDRRTCVVPSV